MGNKIFIVVTTGGDDSSLGLKDNVIELVLNSGGGRRNNVNLERDPQTLGHVLLSQEIV